MGDKSVSVKHNYNFVRRTVDRKTVVCLKAGPETRGQQLINLPVKAIELTYAQSDLISDSLAPITSLRQTNEHQ